MATTTEAQATAASSLETAQLMLADLPEVADEWEQLDDGERAAWSLDWGNEMAGLKRIARYAAEGLLDVEQQERYRRLLQELNDQLPTIERLNLRRPPTPPAV
jgi:hypothetical protein